MRLPKLWSPLPDQWPRSIQGEIASAAGGTTRLTTTNVYDNLNRLGSITNTLSSALPAPSYAYAYNSANQRTARTDQTNASWRYGYDTLGQVTSANKFQAGGTPELGSSYAYDYDPVGNRKSATVNRLVTTYSTNLLNQYTAIQAPMHLYVRGTADASAHVTVEGQAVVRQGEEFDTNVIFDPATVPGTKTVKVVAVKNNFGPAGEDLVTEQTRTAFVAPAKVAPTYDEDGNLLDDARWHYTWDAENRLIAMETASAALSAGVAQQKLEFVYDAQGRRISKKVSNGSNGAWTLASNTLFLYDGWNVIAELNALSGNAVACTYAWGLDLSGSPQDAGGVGGLLFASSATSGTHVPCFDGNGNITGYIDGSTGAVSASYEYNAFGETTASDGPAKDAFAFRFSTKYQDAETSQYYYGLRYYSPATGRWLSRDPMEESGGENLYGFVDNAPIDSIDPFGLWTTKGIVKFLCKTQDGREILQGIKNRMAQGWSFKSFDQMMTDLYYSDGSSKRVLAGDVEGYTDKINKVIYIHDDSAADEEAAKTLFHEMLHSARLPNYTRASLQNEEADVYALTEAYSKYVGYSKDPSLWTGSRPDRTKIAQKFRLPLAVPTPVSPSSGVTDSYSNQLEKLPPKAPSPSKEKTPVGTHGAFPTSPRDLLFEIEKYCPCALTQTHE